MISTLLNRFKVEASGVEIFSFLLPYLEKGLTEYLLILAYVDDADWEGEKNSWKDEVIYTMFEDLEPEQRLDVINYISGE